MHSEAACIIIGRHILRGYRIKSTLGGKEESSRPRLLDRVPLELLILSDAFFMFQRIFVLSQLIFDVL
jgi:hypothetical protein